MVIRKITLIIKAYSSILSGRNVLKDQKKLRIKEEEFITAVKTDHTIPK